MIRFTLEEVTEILYYAAIALDTSAIEVDRVDGYDDKVTEYLNAKLEAKQVEEDNNSLRRTL